MSCREYKCAICETWHPDITSRAKCELACAEKLEEEKRKAEEAKKKEEQKIRKEAVDEAFENLHKLVSDYVKDYGYYEYNDGGEDTNFHWPSRLWHRFW